jgi:hypothetical protein
MIPVFHSISGDLPIDSWSIMAGPFFLWLESHGDGGFPSRSAPSPRTPEDRTPARAHGLEGPSLAQHHFPVPQWEPKKPTESNASWDSDTD